MRYWFSKLVETMRVPLKKDESMPFLIYTSAEPLRIIRTMLDLIFLLVTAESSKIYKSKDVPHLIYTSAKHLKINPKNVRSHFSCGYSIDPAPFHENLPKQIQFCCNCSRFP